MTVKAAVAPFQKFVRSPLFLACCTLIAPVSQAQMLEEVIVTAQKRAQNLQDVPIAVSAFTGDMLEQAGVSDMFELQANAPSLRVGQTQSASQATFGIRGIFTSSQNFGLESSVGLYVDGVYRARQGSMINNLVDVAAVEVLRGPQGTLFGRNTPAGAVSIYSVKPDHEGTGFIEGTYGNYDLLSASGAISFSAVENVLAFRATGFTTERDGYVEVVDVGKDLLNDRDRWGVRLQALYTPSDELTVHVIADRSEVDELCCGSGIFKGNLEADDWQLDTPPQTGEDVNLIALGGNYYDGSEVWDYKISQDFVNESSNEDGGLSMQIDWDTDYFTVTSITSYRTFESYDNIDLDFTDAAAGTQSRDAEQNAFTQELRISNDYDNFNYVAGLYYFEQQLDSETGIIVLEDLTQLVGAFGDAFIAGTGALNETEQDSTSFAIFGQADYSLSESFLLTAGLRWTKEDKDLTNVFTEDASDSLDFVSPNWGFWLFPPLAPRSDSDETIDDDRITGTVKLSWFMNDLTMFYASYGTGYKSGGINSDRVDVSVDVLFDPETSESFELGMKADFPDQALRLNIAIHRTDTEDLQTISFNGDSFALNNAGVAETYGFEVEANWQPTDTTRLSLGYAYLNAEYKDFENGDCQIATPWHTGLDDVGLQEDGSCDRSGGMVSGAPENVLVLTGNQEFSLSDNITGFVYGEYIFTDERMTDINNDPLKLDGSYELVNLRMGLTFENYDASVTLWGRNILDEDYTGTIADTVVQNGKLNLYYAERATFGITAKKHF